MRNSSISSFSCGTPSFHNIKIDERIQEGYLRAFQQLEKEIFNAGIEKREEIVMEWDPHHDIEFTKLLVHVIYYFVLKIEYIDGFLILTLGRKPEKNSSPRSFRGGIIKGGEDRSLKQEKCYKELIQKKGSFEKMIKKVDSFITPSPPIATYQLEIVRFFAHQGLNGDYTSKEKEVMFEECVKELLSHDWLLRPIRSRVSQFQRELGLIISNFGRNETLFSNMLAEMDRFLKEVHTLNDLEKFLNAPLKIKKEKEFFITICGGKEVVKELLGFQEKPVLKSLFEDGRRVTFIQQVSYKGKKTFAFSDDRVTPIIRNLFPSTVPLKHIRYNGIPLDLPTSNAFAYIEALAKVVQVDGCILNLERFKAIRAKEESGNPNLKGCLTTEEKKEMNLPKTLQMMTFEAYQRGDTLLRESHPKLFSEQFSTKAQIPQTQILDIEKDLDAFRVIHRLAFVVFEVLSEKSRVVDETKPLARFSIAWTLPDSVLKIKDLEFTKLGASSKYKERLFNVFLPEDFT